MEMREIKVSVFANHKAYACVKKEVTEVVRLIQYDSIIAERTRQYRETMAAMGKKTADEHIKRIISAHFLQVVILQASCQSIANIVDPALAIYLLTLHEHHAVRNTH